MLYVRSLYYVYWWQVSIVYMLCICELFIRALVSAVYLSGRIVLRSSWCHGVWCRGSGVQDEGAGGIQVDIKHEFIYTHTGRKAGLQAQTPGNMNID